MATILSSNRTIVHCIDHIILFCDKVDVLQNFLSRVLDVPILTAPVTCDHITTGSLRLGDTLLETANCEGAPSHARLAGIAFRSSTDISTENERLDIDDNAVLELLDQQKEKSTKGVFSTAQALCQNGLRHSPPTYFTNFIKAVKLSWWNTLVSGLVDNEAQTVYLGSWFGGNSYLCKLLSKFYSWLMTFPAMVKVANGALKEQMVFFVHYLPHTPTGALFSAKMEEQDNERAIGKHGILGISEVVITLDARNDDVRMNWASLLCDNKVPIDNNTSVLFSTGPKLRFNVNQEGVNKIAYFVVHCQTLDHIKKDVRTFTMIDDDTAVCLALPQMLLSTKATVIPTFA